MITIIGRRLVIPDCDRVLGVAGDKNIPIKVKVSADTLNRYFDGKSYSEIAVILKLKHEEKTVELAPILCTHGDDGVYVGDVSLISTVKKGLVTCQALLIAPGSAAADFNLNDAEGLWQSDEDYFYISDDIELKDYASGSDVYTAFQNLLGTISSKITDINDARDDAVSARDDVVSAKDNVDNKVSEFTKAYGEFNEQADKATEHYNSRSNPHEVTAEQVGSYDKAYIDLYFESVFTELRGHKTDDGNPHKVTANQVGAYGIEETYSREEVFNKDEISLMFEEHGGADVEVDELLDGNSNNPVANKVLYDKFAGIDGKIGNIDKALGDYVKNTDYATNDKHGIIKGDTALGIRINTSGAAYIDRATEAQIDAKADKFKPIVPSNLEYAVKSVGDGYYATEAQVGDIDTALDAILDIQANLTGMADVELPGGEDE